MFKIVAFFMNFTVGSLSVMKQFPGVV